MDDAIKALLAVAGQYGIGVIVGAVFLLLYLVERKAHTAERDSHNKTAEKLFALSAESIKSDMEHTAAIRMLSRVLDSIDRRVK